MNNFCIQCGEQQSAAPHVYNNSLACSQVSRQKQSSPSSQIQAEHAHNISRCFHSCCCICDCCIWCSSTRSCHQVGDVRLWGCCAALTKELPREGRCSDTQHLHLAGLLDSAAYAAVSITRGRRPLLLRSCSTAALSELQHACERWQAFC
jgi:hypothetical protein